MSEVEETIEYRDGSRHIHMQITDGIKVGGGIDKEKSYWRRSWASWERDIKQAREQAKERGRKEEREAILEAASQRRTESVDPRCKNLQKTIIVDATHHGDATAYRLALHLAEYTSDVALKQFPAKNGYFTLHECPFPRQPYPIGGSVSDMLGQLHPEGGEVVDTPWLIRIEFNTPCNGMMEIVVRCREPAVKPYFDRLTEELKRCSVDGGAYGWGTLKSGGIELDLEPEAFAIVLAKMGGRVPAERMAEFATALFSTQYGREMLRKSQQEEVELSSDVKEDVDRPDWLPKKKETLDKWKPIWCLWIRMKKEYQGLWEEGRVDDPEPTISDLSDKIKLELGISYCNRRLRDVVRAGKNGWLN